MTYVQGFVAPVPTAKQEEYRKHAEEAWPLFKEYGATRQLEAWGDDVPQGKVTDFQGSVQATDDETVVFSWMEYPDRATYDSAIQKMMEDPRMEAIGATMPFDGKRMIYGGFAPFVDEGTTQGAYTDGFILPVSEGNREAYRAMAQKAAGVFQEYGATRVVEAWGDDVPDGEITSFGKSVKAEGDEKVVFSWIEWPSKETRDEGWKKVMEDERMKPEGDMPFDGQRMFWGGFKPIVDAHD